jgi:NAD(P)-dependent dehydrogenase (short-subunit alcohol dehydrogenase family)
VANSQRGARFGLDDRVALITGAGTGIGRGVALVLAEHGADIVLAARRREPLEETAREIEELGRRALVVPTDVTDVEQCEQLVTRAVSELGRLDVLVNNAGGSTTKPIAAWTPEEWHEIIDLNLGSVWFLSRFAAQPMIEGGKGAIVNISSGSSLFAFPMGAPYGASKAGVNNLTASLAAAWTPKGVRVNALAVGAVRTQMLIEDGKRYGLDEAALGAGNSMGRLGEPDEIGYAVLYFASDASSYCSGQTLWINGGPKAAGG